LADGRKKEVKDEIKINKLELETYYTSEITAQVLGLQRYDAILGKPWLYHANPVLTGEKTPWLLNMDRATSTSRPARIKPLNQNAILFSF